MCHVKGPERGWTVTGWTFKVIASWVVFAKVYISGVRFKFWGMPFPGHPAAESYTGCSLL